MDKTRKVCLITGASSGIGKILALGLAEDDYQIVLISRSNDKLKLLAKAIDEKRSALEFPPTEYFALSVDDTESVNNAVEKILHKFGRIDILINNAGVAYPGNWDCTYEHFDEQMNINFKGTFNFVHACVPFMKKQGKGYIFNIASRRGKIASYVEGIYAASKFAVVGFSEALYKELSPLGIKVTAICPGWVDTPMMHNTGINPEQMMRPEDMLLTVKYLLNLSATACVKDILLEPKDGLA